MSAEDKYCVCGRILKPNFVQLRLFKCICIIAKTIGIEKLNDNMILLFIYNLLLILLNANDD